MNKLLIASFLLSTSLFADCTYTIQKEDFTANWTAFKTPAKVGVSGRFRDLGLKKEILKEKDLKSALNGLTFNINAKSVWTRNASRDAKLIKYFFSNMKNKSMITGFIKEYDDEDLLLHVNLNGTSKDVPMKVTLSDSIMSAKGTIDVFDFALSDNLSAINKACKTLHKGKTWNDVALELKVNFSKTCD